MKLSLVYAIYPGVERSLLMVQCAHRFTLTSSPLKHTGAHTLPCAHTAALTHKEAACLLLTFWNSQFLSHPCSHRPLPTYHGISDSLSLSLLEMKGIWQQHLFVSDFSSISLSGLLPVARSICTHRYTEHEGRHCTPSLSQMRGPQLQSSDLQGRLECQGWGGAVRDSRRWSKPETWQRALVLGHLTTHIQTK